MLGNVYDALRSAGARDERVRKAAQEIAAHAAGFAKLARDVPPLKRMVGFNIALTMPVAGLVLRPGARG